MKSLINEYILINLPQKDKWDMTQEPIINDAVDYEEKLDFEAEMHQASDDEFTGGKSKLKSVNQIKWDDDDEFDLEQQRQRNRLTEDPEKAGEAALYGVYFQDQNDYDYLKHMKSVENVPGSFIFDADSKTKVKMGGIVFKVRDLATVLIV